MWSAPNQPIPEHHIREEHLRVLREAIELEDPSTEEVFAALHYLERKLVRKGGFINYRRWLAGAGESYYYAGLSAIQRTFG